MDRSELQKVLNNLRANYPADAEVLDAHLDSLYQSIQKHAAPTPPAEQASGGDARELLAREYEADGFHKAAEWMRDPKHAGLTYAEAAAVRAIEAALSQRPVVEIPLNDDTKSILGRMCFQCIHHAKALRLLGRDIPARAEDEQAAVLHWMLNLYLKHGEAWMDAGNAELEQARALAPQQPEKGEG